MGWGPVVLIVLAAGLIALIIRALQPAQDSEKHTPMRDTPETARMALDGLLRARHMDEDLRREVIESLITRGVLQGTKPEDLEPQNFETLVEWVRRKANPST